MTTYICHACAFSTVSFNTLIEHDIHVHGVKPVDPGNEFSSPSVKKLADVIAWVRKQPDANLKTGEGKLLLDEIDRVAGLLLVAQTEIKQLHDELVVERRRSSK